MIGVFLQANRTHSKLLLKETQSGSNLPRAFTPIGILKSTDGASVPRGVLMLWHPAGPEEYRRGATISSWHQ